MNNFVIGFNARQGLLIPLSGIFVLKQVVVGEKILDALKSDRLKNDSVTVLNSLYLQLLIREMGETTYLQGFCED